MREMKSIYIQPKGGDTNPVNQKENKEETICNEIKEIRKKEKKKEEFQGIENGVEQTIVINLKKYKITRSKSKAKLKSEKKKRKQKNEMINKDYATILAMEEIYLGSFDQNKQFMEQITNFKNVEIINNCHFDVFFYKLFIKGSFLNEQALENALMKDLKKNKNNNSLNNNNNNNNSINGDLSKEIVFLRGKHSRLLLCDFLKVLFNSIQNEEVMNSHFNILEYTEEYVKKGLKITCMNVNNNNNNNNTNNSNKEQKSDNGMIAMHIQEIQQTNLIKMNEDIYNKILHSFITELKSFIFSLLKKITTSQVVAQIISVFCEICLMLTPYYVSIVNFIDILNDFANVIPLSYIGRLIEFFEKYKNKFIEKYKEFQNFIIFNDPNKIQSVGARLIGFIKMLQNKITLHPKNMVEYVFFLNLLLSECLPLNHLGFCNRQSINANPNFTFYNSFDSYRNSVNSDVYFFNEFEMNLQENTSDLHKIQTIVTEELQRMIEPTQGESEEPKYIKEEPEKETEKKEDMEKKEEKGIAGEQPQESQQTNNGKRKRENENEKEKEKDTLKEYDNSNEYIISKKDIKKMKFNKMCENLNETNKSYKVYLLFILLLTFLKDPILFLEEQKGNLEDVYTAFKVVQEYFVTVKKEKIAKKQEIEQYLNRSDIDFLSNTNMYKLLIKDEHFVNVFFFSLWLIVNYLYYEYNMQPNENPMDLLSSVDKNKQTTNTGTENENRERNGTNNFNKIKTQTNNEPSKTSLGKYNVTEKKRNEEPNQRHTTKNDTNNDSTNNKSEIIENSKFLNTNGNVMTNNGNQKSTKEEQEKQEEQTNSNSNSNQNQEKIRKVITQWNTELANYFNHEKGSFFKYLLSKEYCWYMWKKQFLGKKQEEEYDLQFEFKNIDEEVETSIEKENNKNTETDKRLLKENTPLTNTIALIESFENLNYQMNEYYKKNKNSNHITPNEYQYTKMIDTEKEKKSRTNNFLVEINKIYLRREAEFWELDDTEEITEAKKKEGEKQILMEKLLDKLEDYKKKMQIDNDPINEIEESEKSKFNPVFKLRLAKLFILRYVDLYTIVKSKGLLTDCDFLYQLMVQMDKNLEEKKRMQLNEDSECLGFNKNEDQINIELEDEEENEEKKTKKEEENNLEDKKIIIKEGT